MIAIYKYEIFHPDCTVDMPQSAKIYDAQYQSGKLCIWARVDTSKRNVKRRIRVMATGEAFEGDVLNDGVHIATVQNPPYVWHIYDMGEF